MSDLRARRRAPAAAMALALAVLGGACGSGSSATTDVMGRAGAIEILDAYLPAPASPSVAALYFTARNTGSTIDELVGFSTPDASSSMLMTEVNDGSSESMQDLPSLALPAHGKVSLSPGHIHGMLENPAPVLKVGAKVPVTLRFAHAGTVTVEVPVVPLSAVVDGGDTGGGSGTSMSNMPGM